MAIEDLLDHRCDIYHLKKSEKTVGYGLPSSSSFEYPEKPDEKEIPCHFGVESFGTGSGTEQKQPQNILSEKVKLTLLCGTDIRINDKIIDRDSGLEYIAEKTRNIRNHHIFVYVKRKEAL